MAKTIKCPTCSTPIEVNPQALGQVVKCPGCGKGIKLVAKNKSGPPAAPGATAAGYSAAMNAASRTGDTMRSFAGEPALNDEPPKLDATCARCGNMVDESDLVEDEGELVCKECAIASAAERSGGGIEEYAPAPYVPSRRGKLINLTPSFFAFVFFALLLGGAQIFLNMNPPPAPSPKMAKASPVPRPTSEPTLAPAGAGDEKSDTTAESNTQAEQNQAAKEAEAQDKADAEWEQAHKEDITMRLNKANQALAEGKKEDAEQLYKDAFNFIEGRKFKDPVVNSTVATAAKLWSSMHAQQNPAPDQTAANAQNPPAPSPDNATTGAENANEATSSSPLAQGIAALKQKDYPAAARIFEEQRLKVLRPPIPATLSNEQALVLVGKAAADLGRGRADDGRPAIDLAYNKGVHSRAAVLNRAMIYLAGAHASIKDLIDAIKTVRGILDSAPKYDDLAANVYGMLLDRLGNMSINSATRADVQAHQKYLDDYNARFSQEHEGKLKWGTEWLPPEDVKRYRMLKGSVQDAALTQLYRQLDIAKARAAQAQKTFDAASKTGTPTTTLKTQLDVANEQLKQVQDQIDNAKQAVQPQRWIEKFEPVIPDEAQT
ncbi:MAG TPA: hypothetical protein VF669_07045 [Tepidisphaeraceae bacterium]|jgi:hypothetical protein